MNTIIKENGWPISKKTLSFLLAAFTFFVCGLFAGDCIAQSDEDVVKQFFPQWLVDKSTEIFKKGGPEPSQFYDFVLADLNGTGEADFIVAAYTNGFSAAIRVLKKQGDKASLVFDPKLRLGGIVPEIELLDLDNDRRPEIIVSFSGVSGALAKWVFKWNGTALNLIGPTVVNKNGDLSTLLRDADFVDLDGDGILEIINPPFFDQFPDPEYKLDTTFTGYKLKGDKYTSWKSISFYGTFIRNTSTPAVTNRNFTVDRTDIPYFLTIVSGDNKGNNRVSSAVIRLNGQAIAGPARFNQKVSTFSIPVNLQTSNTISVELRSAPDSQLTIFVEPQP